MEILKRKAFHSGRWYNKDPIILRDEIRTYIEEAKLLDNNEKIKSILVPHSALSSCGKISAWAYKNINVNLYDTIVIIGPCHHTHIHGCALSQYKYYESPLGDIEVDFEYIQKLLSYKNYSLLDESFDKKEHSIEMQLPFIKYIFGNRNFKIIPILTGIITNDEEELISQTLIELYSNPKVLFVISTDLNHWGDKYKYTYINDNMSISETINFLDTKAMSAIESLNPYLFNEYINEYGSKICGKRSISILLLLINRFINNNIFLFIQYEKSKNEININDNIESYAAGLNYINIIN